MESYIAIGNRWHFDYGLGTAHWRRMNRSPGARRIVIILGLDARKSATRIDRQSGLCASVTSSRTYIVVRLVEASALKVGDTLLCIMCFRLKSFLIDSQESMGLRSWLKTIVLSSFDLSLELFEYFYVSFARRQSRLLLVILNVPAMLNGTHVTAAVVRRARECKILITAVRNVVVRTSTRRGRNRERR